MARHRIGNDITIVWTVNDGNGNPLLLSDKDVRLYYSCESGRYKAEITIQDTNKVVWDFYGGLQKALGAYSLTLEILQSEGKRSIKKDVCGAFILVGKDCEADAKETTVNGEIAVYQEMITTNLDIARISPIIPVIVEDENGVGYWYVDGVNTGERATGESAYDYAVSKGYEGTEEEYANLLAAVGEGTIQKIGGTISSSSDSSLAYGYESRIDLSLSKGSKIRLDIDNQSAFVSGKTIAFVSDGFSATIYKQFPFNAFDVELANDMTYVRCSVNPPNVSIATEVAMVMQTDGLLSSSIDSINDRVEALSEEITYQIGEHYSATAATHLSYGYTNRIDHSLSKGATIHISLDNQSAFVNGKTIAFVSDGFATIYKQFPFDAFDVELQNDATYVRCSVNPDGVKSVADVAFAIDVFGFLSGKINALEQKDKDLFKSIARPIITVIDDDTLGYDSVKLFHDVCVQNGIKGTYATLTSIALSDERLISLMQQYEQEGFHFAIHGKTQSPAYSPQFNAAEAEKDFVEGMRQMQSANFLDWKFFIIPYGAYQPELQQMAKKWGCKCAVGIGQNSYIKPSEKVNRFYLPRAGFNAKETGSVTYEQLKAMIDEAASNNGWVLVGTHIYDGWTEELLSTKFAEMVQYAKNAGLTFVTLNEGYRQFEPYFTYNEMH